jgi:predicted RNA-binding Zn ribbon-like protein
LPDLPASAAVTDTDATATLAVAIKWITEASPSRHLRRWRLGLAMMMTDNPGRLKIGATAGCTIVFVDESSNRSRRWSLSAAAAV